MTRYLSVFVCALVLLGSARADAQTTALYVDSQPGDGIANGVDHTYFEGDLTFTAGSDSAPDRVVFWLYTPGTFSFQWSLEFWGGGTLTPRAYENAGDSAFRFPLRPGLRVSGLGFGCSPTGRFVVYEVEFDSLGHLAKFAADFEQHCNDRAAALFGAIRYKSTRGTLVPFDGVYPVYTLHIDASPFGRVTGTGIDCGNGGTDCDQQYGEVTDVALTATPASGYAFLGWSTDCAGRLNPATLNVSQRRRCSAVFDALPDSSLLPPLTGGSALFVDREATSYRAADRWIWLPANARFLVEGDANFIRATVNTWDGDRWTIEFAPAQGQILQPGTYNRARRYPFRSSMVPGFDLSGRSEGCNALLARFVIYELSFDGAGKVQRFAADFEQHCENEVAAYTGSVRFNSTRAALIPFDGAYPIHRLTIAPPVNGSVVSAGIDCNGGGGPDCTESYAAGGTVTVVARPAPGYRFVGWTDECSGSTYGTVLVTMTEQCGAIFDPVPGSAGTVPDDVRLGALSVFKQPGVYNGPERRHVWTRADSQIGPYTGYGPLTPRFVSFLVTAQDGRTVTVALTAPQGEILRPGDFNGAGPYPFQEPSKPGLTIFGYGLGCNQLIGRFRVYEAHFDATGKVDRFAADFEQPCNYGDPAVFGAIRFNSTRSSLIPFDGEFLTLPDLTLDNPADGSSLGRPFMISGWAINRGETSGTGVDGVHIYAFPVAGGAAIFLGVPTYGLPRPDVGAAFGARFTNAGFSMIGGEQLAPGAYSIAAFAHDTVTGTFNAVKTATITVNSLVPTPYVRIDYPAAGAAVAGTFEIGGWALDAGAPSGTGIDAIHVYAVKDGAGTPIFLGVGDYGQARPDIAAIFGDRFAPSGYHLTVSGVGALTPGTYTLYVYARSTVNGQFFVASRAFTRVPGAAMAVGPPADGAHVSGSFLVAGWAIDADAPSGSGVDGIHVWAWQAGGSPVFLGATTTDTARSDVAAIFGDRFLVSGFSLIAPPLPPGRYVLAVFAHSAATGTFSQVRTLTIDVD
jgi:hypothetical protein